MRKGWLAAPLVLVAAALIFATTATGSGAKREERRHVPPRHGERHRLAQPVRRLQPGRVQRVRVHLPGPRPVRQQPPLRAVLREVVAVTRTDGKTWTFKTQPHAKWSDGKPLTAADAAWTINTDIKYKNGGAAEHGRTDQPHHRRDGSERDDARRPLRAGAQSELRARTVPAVLHPPEAHLVAAPRQQRRRPEDVPEQRARRRLRPVQPRQVPEEPDRDLQAQRLLLGRRSRRSQEFGLQQFSNDDAMVTALQGARPRRDRGRPRDRDEDAAPGRLRRLGRPGARPDRLHHQLEPAEEAPPRAPQPQGQGGVRPRDRPQEDRSASPSSAPRSRPNSIIPASAGAGWHNPHLKMVSFNLKLANKLLDQAGYKRGPGRNPRRERPEDVLRRRRRRPTCRASRAPSRSSRPTSRRSACS